MKIQKFNENLEYKYCYFLTIHENFDENYIFDSEKDICNFMINYIYSFFKSHENVLVEIEEDWDIINLNKIDDIFVCYNNLECDYDMTHIIYEKVKYLENIELKNWIEVRMNSKKYNI